MPLWPIMILLTTTAAFVGVLHSLAPGHWLPVVLMTKARRWPLRTACLGAAIAASGHVLMSLIISSIALSIGARVLVNYESAIEQYAAAFLILFGLVYSAVAVHARWNLCCSHVHGAPTQKSQKRPFLFLFSLGLSPCVAALPVFFTAAVKGIPAITLTMLSFSMGVLFTFITGTALVSLSLIKLDHPILEHYGDVITGIVVALMGIVLIFIPI